MGHCMGTKRDSMFIELADFRPGQTILTFERDRALSDVGGRQEYRCGEAVLLQHRESITVEIRIAIIESDHDELFGERRSILQVVHCMRQAAARVSLRLQVLQLRREHAGRRCRPIVRVHAGLVLVRDAVVHQDRNRPVPRPQHPQARRHEVERYQPIETDFHVLSWRQVAD